MNAAQFLEAVVTLLDVDACELIGPAGNDDEFETIVTLEGERFRVLAEKVPS